MTMKLVEVFCDASWKAGMYGYAAVVQRDGHVFRVLLERGRRHGVPSVHEEQAVLMGEDYAIDHGIDVEIYSDGQSYHDKLSSAAIWIPRARNALADMFATDARNNKTPHAYRGVIQWKVQI